jgi:hypothetical protein
MSLKAESLGEGLATAIYREKDTPRRAVISHDLDSRFWKTLEFALLLRIDPVSTTENPSTMMVDLCA